MSPPVLGTARALSLVTAHLFLIVKRDFACTKTRYRGIAKNLNHFQMLFAPANWLMRARAVALTQATA